MGKEKKKRKYDNRKEIGKIEEEGKDKEKDSRVRKNGERKGMESQRRDKGKEGKEGRGKYTEKGRK